MTTSPVVVGVDSTSLGLEALRQAIAVRLPGSELIAVTVVEEHLAAHAGVAASYAADQLTDEALRVHERAAEMLIGHDPAATRLLHGQPAEVLQTMCEREGAALAVVGARHSSRIGGILLGATSSSLLHSAPCSVLFAKPAASGDWLPKRIVVGTDGSEHSARAPAAAEALAERSRGTVTQLTATGSSTEAVGELVEASLAADLIVLGSRGLTGVRTLGSVAERVAHQAHCSVLVVRPGQA